MSLKVHLDTFFNITRCFIEKIFDLIKEGLIVTYILIYVLDVRELFGRGFINKVRVAHQINVLEAFL